MVIDNNLKSVERNTTTLTNNPFNLRSILIILFVIALGLIIINQVLGYFYKAHFLKSPCNLCAELNEDVRDCILTRTELYPDGTGGWKSLTTENKYNITLP